MAVAYDATGVGASGVNAAGSSAAGTAFNHTAASGADVFFAIQFTNSGTGSPSSVQYNGVAMTLVDSQRVGAISNAGATFLYRAAGAGTGNAQSFTYNVPAVAFYVANSVSYTGVSTVSAATKNSGSSTSATSGSITVTTGQMALCAFGQGNSGSGHTMSSPTGGTNRVLATVSTGTCDLGISDSTATATFGATLATTSVWSTVAVVLQPPAAITVTPTGASVAITGSTPSLGSTIVPSGAATVTASGSTPSVGIGVAPSAATVTAAGSTPVLDAMVAPTGATATATTSTPVVTVNGGLTPAAALVSVAGSTPVLDAMVAPTAPTVAITGATPVVIVGYQSLPTGATVALAGSTPSLGLVLHPASAAITVTTSTPFEGMAVVPTGATVAITGSTPAVTIGAGFAALVTITGSVPQIAAGAVVTLDAVGAGASGAGSFWSWTHANAGNCLVVGVSSAVTGGSNPFTVRFGSTPLTYLGASASSQGQVSVFALLNPPLGAQPVIVASTGFVEYVASCSVSYFNVSSIRGSAVLANTGTGGNASIAMAAASLGELAVGFFQQSGDTAGFSSFSGTQRYSRPGVSGQNTSFLMGDSAVSGAGLTLSARPGSSAFAWASAALVLEASVTISPASASVVVNTSGGIGPFSGLCGKLSNGQSATMQIIGDSTAWGAFDTGSSYTVGVSGPLYGWPGRLALALGIFYDANVVVSLMNYPSTVTYRSPVTLHTSTQGSSGPTLTVLLGGWPGAVVNTYLTWIVNWLPVWNPEVVIIHTGFNETSTTTFTSDYTTLIGYIQNTFCPNAPIICTTENAAGVSGESGHPTFAALFGAMTTLLLPGKSLPLSPALQPSTAFNNLWVLDTQQAGQTAANLAADGIHPIGSGYAEQAQFMLNQLTVASAIIEDAGLFIPTSAMVSITRATPVVTTAAGGSQTLNPAGATVTIRGSAPPLSVSPASATVAITGSTPTIVNGLSPTIRPATGTVTVTGSVPTLSFRQTVNPTSATVTVRGSLMLLVGVAQTVNPASGTITITGGTLASSIPPVPFEAIPPPPARAFPSGPVTPLGGQILLDGVDENLWATSADGSYQFYLKGGCAPVAPGLPGQDGLVVQSVDFSAPFKHKDLQAADQDGTTWNDTVYEPGMITLQGEVHAATPQGLTRVWDAWQGAWNPRQLLTMEHITLDGGYWYAQARLADAWQGPIKQDRRFLYRPFTHKCRIDDAFWKGPDSTDAFGASYETFGEAFIAESGFLSPTRWNVSYSAGHTGSVQMQPGIGAAWVDGGNSTQSATCIYTTPTDTDFQVITVQLGGAWEGITLGGFAANQILGRVDNAGNAVMCGISNTGVYVYRINSGVPTVMYYRPILFPPLPNETWTFIVGADPNNARSYAVVRSGYHVTILGLFTFGFGGEVLRFAEHGTSSVISPSARGVGFGMVTAGGLLGAPQANPIPTAAFSAADNSNGTESGTVQLSNIGTEDGYADFTLTGPGTFGIGDGPNATSMIHIGPLAYGQVAQVTTLPRMRSVVDVNSPTTNLYPLMSGRFSNASVIPGVATPSDASPVQIPVSILGGGPTSKIVATLTPRRISPA